MALNINPRPKPVATIPFAMTTCRPENHTPAILWALIVIVLARKPNMSIVAARVIKPVEKPRNAPVNPAIIQATQSVSFVPNLSPIIPPKSVVHIPARPNIPHTVPSCTRLRLSSIDISLKKTGMHINGAVIEKTTVRQDSETINHR